MHFRTFYAYGFSCDIVLDLRSVRDPGLPPGRSPCPDALLRVGGDEGVDDSLIGALMDGLGRWVASDF